MGIRVSRLGLDCRTILDRELMIGIGIAVDGIVDRSIIYALREKAVWEIASLMLMGMPVKDKDLALSGVKEFTNMITGDAVGYLSKLYGRTVDITPPKLMKKPINLRQKAIVVPVVLSNEKLEIALLKEGKVIDS